MLDVAAGFAKALDGLLGFVVIARYGDKYARRLTALVEDEVGDGDQPDAWISQFAPTIRSR
jgi:hypothetical protein